MCYSMLLLVLDNWCCDKKKSSKIYLATHFNLFRVNTQHFGLPS